MRPRSGGRRREGEYEDVRLNSADGNENRPIRGQPEISSPIRLSRWNSLPGSGCAPVRTRFFPCSRSAQGVLYGSKACSAPAYVYLVFHPAGTKVSLGSRINFHEQGSAVRRVPCALVASSVKVPARNRTSCPMTTR